MNAPLSPPLLRVAAIMQLNRAAFSLFQLVAGGELNHVRWSTA